MGSFLSLAHAADRIPGVAAKPGSYFYTGKPYDADLGGYTFAFRNYDPQICRWTAVDPSGFPDVPNNRLYGGNHVTFALDPDGFTFLFFDGSSLSEWSGAGYQGQGNPVGWGTQIWDIAADSGGTAGSAPIPNGWWSVGDINTSPSHGSWWSTKNGTYNQGYMAQWSNNNYTTPYVYNPNDPHDAAIGPPQNVQFDYTLTAEYGTNTQGRTNLEIHPDGRDPGTHGCIGILNYSDCVSVSTGQLNGLDLLVE
jgi:RHS repeat-associated protein